MLVLFYTIQAHLVLTKQPLCAIILNVANAPLAQLDRVTGYEPVGQGFESLTACQKNALLSVKTKARFCFIRTSVEPLIGHH